MKVSGINGIYSVNHNSSAFKGLEGYPIVKPRIIDIDHDYFDRKIPYFPFKDETKEQIEAFVKRNTYEEEYTAVIDYESFETMKRHDNYYVEVKETLPFDRALWNAYKKNKYKLDVADKTMIEDSLRKLKLDNYIRKNPIKYIIAKLAK